MSRSKSECAAPAPEAATDQVVRRAARDPRLREALRDLYRQVDATMAVRGGRCLGGGACCKFDLTGRCVYVTTAELAFLLAAAPADPARVRRRRCPYQVGPRCTARPRRPLGCRTFFCDPALADASPEVYEWAHGRLRALHERLGLPYRYEELTGALARLLAPARTGPGDAPHRGACATFLSGAT